MNKNNFQTVKLSLCFLCVFFSSNLENIVAQSVCNNKIWDKGAFTYEYWKDQGSGCMTVDNGEGFYVNWSNINNLLARKGVRPGSKNQTIKYSADYTANGNSYLCAYGWTTNPLVEYYIVENWGSWRPPGGKSKGTVTTDGGTYDIYETIRNNKPSIEGTKTFKQYWSVKKDKRSKGTITCANHFKAWESKGMNMGDLYEVSFTVEGYQSKGACDVYELAIGEGNGSNDNNEDTDTQNTIIVKAKGLQGNEKININVGNTIVATHMMSKNYKDYKVVTDLKGVVDIEFFNDIGENMDILVDHVIINGNKMESEDQKINTGAWADGYCGYGSNTEWMHCNGIIRFGNTNNRIANN